MWSVWDEIRTELETKLEFYNKSAFAVEIVISQRENMTIEELNSCQALKDHYSYRFKLTSSLLSTMDILDKNLFILLKSSSSDDCDLHSDECFPLNNKNDLTDILSLFSEEEIERNINEFAISKRIFNKKLIFRKNPGSRKIGLYALEDIKKGSKILSISSDDLFGNVEFYKILKIFNISKLDFKTIDNRESLDLNTLSFIFALHYHLANLWGSNFFGNLIGLPKRIPLSYYTFPSRLIKELSPYERSEIFRRRKNVKSLYLVYMKAIKDYVPAPVLMKILNGTGINFANFAYCLSIYETKYVELEVNNEFSLKSGTRVLIPGVHYINSIDKVSILNSKNIELEDNHVYLLNLNNVSSGEEILRNFGDHSNLDYIYNFGSKPNKNDIECVVINDPKLQRKLIQYSSAKNNEDFKCLKRNIINNLNVLLNIQQSLDFKNCIGEGKDNEETKKDKILIKLCWQASVQERKTFLLELKTFLTNLKSNQKTSANILISSKEKSIKELLSEDLLSYELMIEYYEDKVILIDFLVSEIENIEVKLILLTDENSPEPGFEKNKEEL